MYQGIKSTKKISDIMEFVLLWIDRKSLSLAAIKKRLVGASNQDGGDKVSCHRSRGSG